jgi:hypothetical protein
MKKLMFKVAIVGAAFFAVTSCKVTDEILEDVIGVEDRIVKGEAIQKLYSADGKDTTTLSIDYAFFSRQNSSFVMDSVYKDSVNSIVRDVVIAETMTQDRTLYQPVTRHFFDAQLDSVAKEWNIYKEEESNPWEIEVSMDIQDHPTFVELTTSGWTYTGGAHGNGFNTYFLIDRTDGKMLTLRDFFTNLDELNTIAEKYFRAIFGLSETESLNEYGFWFDNDNFTVNENFTSSGDSLLFFYNTYEIAPYSGGPTELLIPIE